MSLKTLSDQALADRLAYLGRMTHSAPLKVEYNRALEELQRRDRIKAKGRSPLFEE